MKQVLGKGEAKPKHIRSVLYADVKNTPHESSAKIENIYRKVLTTQAYGMINSSQLDVEDIRMQWTTYEKMNQWLSDSKQVLLDYGFADRREKYCSR